MKPIKVYVVPAGPNPWKVVWVLEELELEYEIDSFSFDVVKKKPFIDVNPNGRVPAIYDPNTDITLWESGAILLYLIEQYDTSNKISYSTLKERHLCNQWLAFQISGQGPYVGQLSWFRYLHAEKLPSAIDRYAEELKRILGVLETSLTGKQWLVGDKCTFADLVFVPWNDRIHAVMLVKPEEKFIGFPNVQAWHERMTSRPTWAKIMETKTELLDAKGLQPNGMPKGVTNPEEFKEAHDKLHANPAS